MRAIIWDFEGTLGRRMPGAWTSCSIEVLDRHEPGHAVTIDVIRPHFQTGFPWHSPDVAHPELTDAASWWSRTNEVVVRAYEAVGLPPERSRELAALYRERFLDPACWEPFPDTREVLGRARRSGFRNVILSNHTPELDQILAALGLSGEVDAVVNSAMCGYEKPHPEAFRLARLAAGDPETIWMVGDRYDADIAGAEAVGIPAVLVHTTDPRAARSAETLTDAFNLLTSLSITD